MMALKSASADDTPLSTVTWTCKCGMLSFAHQPYCGRCGEVKPPPPKKERK